MNTKLFCLPFLLMISSLGICQTIQVGNMIYKVDPTYRYPLHQDIIKPHDRKILTLATPRERMHRLF